MVGGFEMRLARIIHPFSSSLTAAVAVLSILWALFSPGMAGEQNTEPVTRQRRMLAERFHFTPNSLKMKLGTRLEIQLTSRDTFHGFRILGTDINVEIPARGKGKATIVFEPEKEGVYEFVCSKRCGAGHTEMRGRIEVKP